MIQKRLPVAYACIRMASLDWIREKKANKISDEK